MTLNELKAQIAQALDMSVEELRDDTGPENVYTWDSVASVAFMEILNVDGEKARELTTVGQIIDYARRKDIVSDD